MNVLLKARYLIDKILWGARVVGVPATMAGAVRMATVYGFRPTRSEIRLRSGGVLEFAYPSQFAPNLVMFGDLVDPEFAFLRRWVRPGWRFIDVGAAIGQFSIFASRFPGALVHALEPSDANIVTLERNIERNRVADRVKVHRLALSSSDGEARFATAERTWMSGLTSNEHEGSAVVEVRTLSRVFSDLKLDRAEVVKINVAGFEPAVLKGAQPCLEEGRIDILILLLGLESLPWYEVVARLGYRFFYYHPQKDTLFEVTYFDKEAVFDHRPWPARHIIAVRGAAIRDGLLAGLKITAL